MKLKLADYVMSWIYNKGIKTVFTVSGGGSIFLCDSLANSKNLNSNDNREGSVDITREMGLLAENQIKYEFATRALSRMYKGISTSITGKTR